ncbi:TIGR03085 family metal-binding protein [Corynebacterium tuberculostearicum]|uniref:TIGR03085 family protein n=1 Tax=Corynebacterium tuberculostearicum TaxID=38304 RepID=A0A8I1HYU6_9CORY|nr:MULTISPECIES: TIGR03085 family metal-binding protein [Corynebacterium]MBK3427651.1 TIGR03085 family protein [Corynebacterium tuberculostearicum]MCG7444606.1 TIGR03085 family metal-binding protein [Corynebacterium sp. ACRPO]
MLGLMSFSSAERAKMVALFHKLGPDAPTLCEGWTTRDLAVHLWVRENRPDAAAGIFVNALSGRLEKESRKVAERDFDELVDDWGRGPASYNPVRFVDAQQNFVEHFVHHEDIRRANGMGPRDFSAHIKQQMHSYLKLLAKVALRKSERPVILQPEGLPRIVAADTHGVADKGDAVVRVSGEVGELILWSFGRDAAEVKIEGEAEAIVKSIL